MPMYYWLIRESRLFAQNREKKADLSTGASFFAVLFQRYFIKLLLRCKIHLELPTECILTYKGSVTCSAQTSSQGPCSLTNTETCTVKDDCISKLQKPEAHFQCMLHKWLQSRFIPWAFRDLKMWVPVQWSATLPREKSRERVCRSTEKQWCKAGE